MFRIVMLMLLFRLINIFMNSIPLSSIVFMMVIMPMMVDNDDDS